MNSTNIYTGVMKNYISHAFNITVNRKFVLKKVHKNLHVQTYCSVFKHGCSKMNQYNNYSQKVGFLEYDVVN